MTDGTRTDPSPARSRRGSIPDSLGIVLALAMFMALGYVAEVGWRRFVVEGFVSASRDVLWMAPFSAAIHAAVILAPVWLAAPLLERGRARALAVFASAGLATFAALLPWTSIHRLAAAMLALGVASAVMRWCTASSSGGARLSAIRRLGGAIALALVASGALVTFLRAQERRAALASLPTARTESPNVLVLLLDTVRASALSMYGYARTTSPAMDSVAAGGVLFEHAVATSPWTLPSHATLFTGEFSGLLSTSFRSPLDRTRATLAEQFRAAGYETVGVVGNPYYTAWDSGLGRGFIQWTDYDRSVRQLLRSGWIGQSSIVLQLTRSRSVRDIVSAVRGAEFLVIPKPGGEAPNATGITDALLAWEESRGGRPYFAFANYFDAHEAYVPPPKYRTRFATSPTPRDLHDAEIAYIDDEVARLLATLRARGALENTIVVITSDHGEQFKEHGISGHGNSLYYQLLQIPLVIRHDGHIPAGRRVPDIVSLRDVGATLLDLAGVVTTPPFPGHSLVATWTSADSAAPLRSPAISELSQDPIPRTEDPISRSQAISLVEDDGLHGIFRNLKNPRPLMYNVRADPEELVNLATQPDGLPVYEAQRQRLRRILVADEAEFGARSQSASHAAARPGSPP